MLLSGCAAMSERECATADWQALGFYDGTEGGSDTLLLERIEACQSHQIGVDEVAYDRGRDKGISRYCTRSGGLRIGEQGGDYSAVCSGEGEQAFLAGFEIGQSTYRLQHRVDQLSSRLLSIQANIQALQARRDEKEDVCHEHEAEHVRPKVRSEVRAQRHDGQEKHEGHGRHGQYERHESSQVCYERPRYDHHERHEITHQIRDQRALYWQVHEAHQLAIDALDVHRRNAY